MEKIPQFSLIIVAAGTGTRMEAALPKQYIPLYGTSILRHTLNVFLDIKECREICIVINPEHETLYKESIFPLDNFTACYGGDTRKESVYNGLKALSSSEDDIIFIHDAARPLISHEEIYNLLNAMTDNVAATLALPVTDTLARYDEERTPVDRSNLWAIQTPQAFHYGLLKNAHEQCKDKIYTDDTGLISDLGYPVKLIQGRRENFKITYPEDIPMAEAILSPKYSTETRTGLGFDVHAFDEVKAKTIRLCGIDIAHDRKLKGHSDADVALHALTDALLGATGHADIGLHFPPSNKTFKDMDSALFLEHAKMHMEEVGGKIINLDLTIICQSPKIAPHREAMEERIAEILKISKSKINVKATTTEHLGFTGREEGIAAQAIANVSMPAALKYLK